MRDPAVADLPKHRTTSTHSFRCAGPGSSGHGCSGPTPSGLRGSASPSCQFMTTARRGSDSSTRYRDSTAARGRASVSSCFSSRVRSASSAPRVQGPEQAGGAPDAAPPQRSARMVLTDLGCVTRLRPGSEALLVGVRRLRRQVDQQGGLVDPVDEPGDGHTGVEQHVDELGRREVLQVLDALFQQSRLVPDVESVQAVQGIGRVQRGNRARATGGMRSGSSHLSPTSGNQPMTNAVTHPPLPPASAAGGWPAGLPR